MKRAVVVTALATGALGFLPLARGPGYEHALLSGLIVPSIAAIASALDRRSSETSVLSGGLRGIAIGAVMGGVALGTALVWGIFFGFCDLLGGLVFWVLTAGMGAILGGLWGFCAGEIARGRRKRSAVLLALGGPVGSALVALWRFWATPAIFAFDPFVGFFSGTLYDTIVEPGAPLITYRAASLVTIAGALLVLSVIERTDRGLRVSCDSRGARARALCGGACLLLSAGSVAFGPSLGHWQTSKTIAAALGGHRSGARCDVVYPDSLREDEAELLVKDCEEQLASVEKVLGARGPERITAFFFRDAAEKKRLMGAADTYIAKPWRNEVYLQVAPYPHPVLGHELAHVVAGSFGRGPMRIAGDFGGLLPNPGLIEGVAVAASPDEDELTDTEWARAMKARKMLPPMKEVFSLQFLGQSAGKSYTLAGAFVRWMMDAYGSETVRAWYSGQSIEALLGKPWDAIDAEFRAFLDRRPVLDAAEAYVAAKFDRPAVFGRRCPHEVDALRREADACRDAHRITCAKALYHAVLARDPDDHASRLSMAAIELRSGDEAKGREALAAIAGDERLPRTMRDRAREQIADLDLLEGKTEQAASTYDDIAAHGADEDAARTLEVKAIAARDPEVRDAVVALLIGSRDRPPDTMYASALLGAASDRGSVLASYILGKNLAQHGELVAAAAFLDRALAAIEAGAKIPSTRVYREMLRVRAVCACGMGDASGIARVKTILGRPGSPFEHSAGGRIDALERLIERCSLVAR